MTPPNDPNSLNDKILDLVLGQLPPEDPGTGAASADAGARAERDRWTRLVSAARTAHTLALDPAAGERIAARVLARVRDEEGRASRPVARRTFWGRVLAVSVAAHAVFLGVFAVRARSRENAPVEPFVVSAVWDTAAGDAPVGDDRAALPLPETPAFDGGAASAMAEARLDVRGLDPADEVPLGSGPTAAGPLGPREIGLRSVSPAFRARTSDPVKRAIEERLSARGSLDTIRRSLTALAALQRPDGSFPAPTGTDVSDATAWTVLPFLGDGSSSRFGPHREVVANAVAFLRGRRDAATGTVAGGDVVLWALAEDQWLAGGFRTPSENRAPAADLRALAARLVPSPEALAPDSVRALALGAAARARVVDAPATTTLAVATMDAWLVGDVRPEDALTRGAAIAQAGTAETFRRFTSRAAATLRALVGDDGLVAAAGDPAVRALATAKALLALQVPFRAE